jgi:hypothetical protein
MPALFIAADFGYVCLVLVFLIFHSRNKPCKIFRAWGYSLHVVMEIVRYLLVCRKQGFTSLFFEQGVTICYRKGRTPQQLQSYFVSHCRPPMFTRRESTSLDSTEHVGYYFVFGRSLLQNCPVCYSTL